MESFGSVLCIPNGDNAITGHREPTVTEEMPLVATVGTTGCLMCWLMYCIFMLSSECHALLVGGKRGLDCDRI